MTRFDNTAPQDFESVRIAAGNAAALPGELTLPMRCTAIVLFAHGSGSSRLSPRNIHVARTLQDAGIGTLLFDLLTPAEDRTYATRFDVALLTERLLAATDWVLHESETSKLRVGYFGASTGAAAALAAAAALGKRVSAVVSRGGRPDLAGSDVLRQVSSPTLLIVGSRDSEVVALNRNAYACLGCEKALQIVPGATHLFEEPGTLEQVAAHARDWFRRWLEAPR